MLINQHGVQLKRFSDDILKGLGKLAGEVVGDLANKDPLSREVFDSILKFRRTSVDWSTVTDRAYYDARALDYPYG